MKIYFEDEKEKRIIYDKVLERLIGINSEQLKRLYDNGLINIDDVFNIINKHFQ